MILFNIPRYKIEIQTLIQHFMEKSNVIALRKDLDPDWDVKQDCLNQFPTLTRAQQMESIPIAVVGKKRIQIK